ncbi:selenium metabolism membrane protein YedE/FdhT [Cohnella lubricantis]|uniref:Selenium metabolism membrane protein YedE/FdhT n=1 Tax=Cohnella lubricantis TaxID=2163172 RepID=A0A841T3G6_9BACL|nr:selenium metabolism membrane protein YedE/FdhT [Cohnella lubricantis]MBB6676133.1 selenium metabolism membrane protein YedE/FdhT [Cohnella lubricantis]MBP2118675.1 putative membrane protein YedE/YeeE [Cohnella lubricantis]
MRALYRRWVLSYWSPYAAMALAGILSAVYFGITKTVWAVTGEFTRLGGHVLEWFGADLSDWSYFGLVGMNGTTWTRTDGWIVWGMFVGALIMVLLNNNFKIRVPRQKRRWIQGFAGGIVAGFGARMALGCNLAAFFTGVPQFSLHAWIFMAATGIGTYLGVKLIGTKWWKGKPALSKGSIDTASQPTKRKVQPILGGIAALLYAALIVCFFATGHPMLGVAALFGAFFGICIERGQICFTSAFRDMWISGRATMTKAILAGMAVSSVATLIILLVNGMDPITKIAAPSTLIGGILFGLGIVMAGGCETGMMYRLMEGQIVFLPVFLGNVIGASFLAYAWDHMGVYDALVASGSKINLFTAWGPAGAIAATLIVLGLVFAIAAYWQKHYRFGTGFKRGESHHVN